MSIKIDVDVSQYGDELLTAYVNGEYEAAVDMWSAVSNNENSQTLIALYSYQNESIVDKTVADAVVECCNIQPRSAMTIEDEKKVIQQWLDGLITQSEMANKLKS